MVEEGDQEIRTVGYVVALLHRRPKGRTKERDDKANETQSLGGLQDTGGVRRGPRREDAGGVGPTIWRASHPDHGMEAAVADTSRWRVWGDDEGHGGRALSSGPPRPLALEKMCLKARAP